MFKRTTVAIAAEAIARVPLSPPDCFKKGAEDVGSDAGLTRAVFLLALALC